MQHCQSRLLAEVALSSHIPLGDDIFQQVVSQGGIGGFAPRRCSFHAKMPFTHEG